MADFYELLGVERDCSQATLRAAYLRQAERYHPDRPSEQGGGDRFKQLRWAYEVLSDPDARADYNLRPERWKNYRTILPTESPPPSPASPAPSRPARMQAVALARRVAARRPRRTMLRVRKQFTQFAWGGLLVLAVALSSELLEPSRSDLNTDPNSLGYEAKGDGAKGYGGPRMRDFPQALDDASSEPNAPTADALTPQSSRHGSPRPASRPAQEDVADQGSLTNARPIVGQGQRPKKRTPPQRSKSFNPIPWTPPGTPSGPDIMPRGDLLWQLPAIPSSSKPQPEPWSPPDWQPYPNLGFLPEPNRLEPNLEPRMAREHGPIELPPAEPPFLPAAAAPWLPGEQHVPAASVLPERNHRRSWDANWGPPYPSDGSPLDLQ